MRREDISTHTPRVGRDTKTPTFGSRPGRFQLTRPVWGVTLDELDHYTAPRFQLTRPVWGVTPPSQRLSR